jgi:hypothetical protein
MKLIAEEQREETEKKYLDWFWSELTRLSDGSSLEELMGKDDVAVGLEFMDFALLSFRDNGRIEDLKQVTRYVLSKAKKHLEKAA